MPLTSDIIPPPTTFAEDHDVERCVQMLRASHIKAWAHCANNAERLAPDNGLLLAPELRIRGLRPEHTKYLAWHREKVFRSQS